VDPRSAAAPVPARGAAPDATREAPGSPAASRPAAPGRPGTVHDSLDALVPEFRAPLERVIERMRSELGYEVSVVESWRDQSRQDALFAQGRTSPGPVVTWTRASRHTEGRAADLVVDGSFADRVAYAHLQRIAREEGLRTLGARDPGHVELPAPSGTPERAAATSPGHVHGAAISTDPAPARAAAPGSVPAVADVATVADLAAVARVAPAADVATVAPVARVAAPAQPGTEPSNDRSMTARVSTRAREGAELAEPATPAAPEPARTALDAAGRGAPAVTAPATPAESRPAQPAELSAQSAARIAEVLRVQEQAPARPLAHLVLRMDAPDGSQDRVRIDLRGLGVGATIDVTDAGAAERLAGRVDELRHALERHGLEADSVRVRGGVRAEAAERRHLTTAAPVADADALRRVATAAQPAATPPGAGPGDQHASHRERSGAHHADDPRREAAHDRRRPRKDTDRGDQP
jgi:peptidoglycan L-alanyl-D-glutamate endopeptidase CwlK